MWAGCCLPHQQIIIPFIGGAWLIKQLLVGVTRGSNGGTLIWKSSLRAMTWLNERRAIGEYCKGLLFPAGEGYKRIIGRRRGLAFVWEKCGLVLNVSDLWRVPAVISDNQIGREVRFPLSFVFLTNSLVVTYFSVILF